MTAQEIIDTLSKHRLTMGDFLLLDESGAFGDKRAELFGGEIFYMSPKHRPHARTVTDLSFAILNALKEMDSDLSVLIDVSLHISDYDVPEPDIILTNDPDGDGVVPLEAAKLVVEVSDSTLRVDLGVKAALYAAAGIAEYWVVDVKARLITQMSEPQPKGYTNQAEVRFGQIIRSMTIAGLTLETPKP